MENENQSNVVLHLEETGDSLVFEGHGPVADLLSLSVYATAKIIARVFIYHDINDSEERKEFINDVSEQIHKAALVLVEKD